jgi:two-component system chemotaxis response regulator CheY
MSKILVVDDAAFMRMMIKDTLGKLGYPDVEEAADGQIAVEKYQQLNPDLVMLDVTMPNLDGIGALKAIKAINPNAKVVMCSAMGQESMVVEAIKRGALDCIVKPFKPDRIAKTMKAVLG